MTKKIYVGNLSYDTTEEGLRSFFSQHGQVESASIISDRMTGRSRGFGFVEMEDSSAQKAIEATNGANLDNRKIVVNEARPREERSGGGRGDGGGGFRGRGRY